MRTSSKQNKVVFKKCEKCDQFPAIIRFWNKKVLCQPCADESFSKWLINPNELSVDPEKLNETGDVKRS